MHMHVLVAIVLSPSAAQQCMIGAVRGLTATPSDPCVASCARLKKLCAASVGYSPLSPTKLYRCSLSSRCLFQVRVYSHTSCEGDCSISYLVSQHHVDRNFKYPNDQRHSSAIKAGPDG
jgi:hypothetical protein